jgi:hypothetical protein
VKGPLFRTIGRGTDPLTTTPLPQANAHAMTRRRAGGADIATKIGIRAAGITAYLKNGGTLERAATRRTTPPPARRSSTIAGATTSASMRWSAFSSDFAPDFRIEFLAFALSAQNDTNSMITCDKKNFSHPLEVSFFCNQIVSRRGSSGSASAGNAGVISMLLHGGCGYANF